LLRLSVFFLFVGVCRADDKLELKTRREKESYTLGFRFGESLKKQQMEIDLNIYTAAIRDSLEGKDPRLSEEEMRAAITAIRQRAYAAQHTEYTKQAAKNLQDSKVFLAKTRKKKA
jgi:FKBP-type peptidyl-prolyl cis-trans isomerase